MDDEYREKMIPMWDETSQARWNELCRKRQTGALTDAEQQEWEGLTRRLEANEWAQLQPAVQRLQKENAALERACLEAEQEKARLSSLVAQRWEEVVNMETVRKEIPYRHLETRPHPWRRQLYIKGRNMTVWQLVGDILTNCDTPEEAAENRDLPLAAVAEALLYCLDKWDIVQADREEEWRRLKESNIIRK